MFTSVCANIHIDGSPLSDASAYEALVNWQLQRIFAKRTGYWVLWQIAHCGMRSGTTVLIMPFTAAQEKADPKHVVPDTHMGDERAAGARTGLLFKSHVKGPGKGSNVLIHYNPDECKALVAEAQRKRTPYVGMDLDEALFHEMLHALRGLQGLKSDLHLTGGYEIEAYQTVEEFFAILLTNIYMAEKGQTQLRRNHLGWDPLPTSLNTSVKFLSDRDNVLWIKYLWHQETELFYKISRVVTLNDFNPLRELAANQEKYGSI
jgi:hypothetical protein